MSGYYRKRVLLLLAVFAAATLFVLVGQWARIPYYPHFDTALCTMPSPAGRTAIVVATFIAATTLATLIAGRVRREAPLFAAAVGLCSLSTHGGRMQYVWMREEFVGLSGRLAVELALLGLTVLATWAALGTFAGRRRSPTTAGDALPTLSPAGTIAAFAVHLVVTGLLIALLLASDAKKQAILGVALASCIGAIAASLSSPETRLGSWLFVAPILVGVAGYLLIGHPALTDGGFFGGLGRASPLDYAGAGTAGAILGRWLGVATEPGTSPSHSEQQPDSAPTPTPVPETRSGAV